MSKPRKWKPHIVIDESIFDYDNEHNDGRQAQYELHRAGNCALGSKMDTKLCALKSNYRNPCPTDYRECPLTKDGEK
jgi:hypothetical protein